MKYALNPTTPTPLR